MIHRWNIFERKGEAIQNLSGKLVTSPWPTAIYLAKIPNSIWKLTKKISAKNRVTGTRHLHRSTSFVAFASHHRHFASKTLDFDPLWQANRKERWLQHKQQIITDITDENDPENLTRLNLEQTNTFWGEVLVSDAKIDCVFGFPWVSFFVFWI